MMLDHLMGETASAMKRPTFTGTLTMRYRRGTPLGPLHLEAGSTARRAARSSSCTISAEGVTVEATGCSSSPPSTTLPRPP